MKILYFSYVDLNTPSGCQTHTLGVLGGLAANGCRLDAVIPRPCAPLHQNELIRFHFLSPYHGGRRYLLREVLYSAAVLWSLCKKHHYDAIYARDMDVFVGPRLCSQFFGIPLFLEVDDTPVEGTYPRLMRKMVELNLKLDYHRASGLIVPSLPRCQIIHRQYRVPLPKIHLIMNGTDELDWGIIPTKGQVRRHLGLPADSFCLGYLGVIYERYDFATMLTAMAACLALIPHLFFIIVGGGSSLQQVKRQAVDLGLADRVVFTGFLSPEEFARVLPAIDVGLMPLTKAAVLEHGPIHTKMATYASFNLPVVTAGYSLEGYPEEVQQGVLLIPPEDAASLAAIILQLHQNPLEAARLAQSLRRLCHEPTYMESRGLRYPGHNGKVVEAAHRKIALNTLLLSATEFLTRMVSLVLVIFVARRLGPEMMGIYAFALTFVNLFDIFISFGLERYIQREVGRQPDLAGPLFSQVFAVKLLAYLASAAVIVIVSLTIVEGDLKRWVVWLLSLSLFFRTNITSSNCFFRAHQQAKYEALVVISFRLIYGGAGLAAILSGQGLLTLSALELTAQAGACALAWWLFIKKIGNPFHRVTWNNLLTLVRSTKDFLFIRVALTVYASLNMFMLSFMAGDVVTGMYAAALRLCGSFDFLPDAFTGAFLPVMSRQIRSGWESFAAIFRPFYKYLLVIGLGLAAVLGGMAEDLILLIFGPAFKPAIPTLTLLGLSLMLTFVNLSLSNGLIALDRERKIVWIILLAVAFNFCLNLALIPAYRQNGAAGATLLSEVLVLFLMLQAMGWHRVKILRLGRVTLRPLLSGLLSFGLGRGLVAWQINFFVGLALMALGFFCFMVWTGALSRGELLAVRELITSKRKELETA